VIKIKVKDGLLKPIKRSKSPPNDLLFLNDFEMLNIKYKNNKF
jgi:hypothetical protein